jgi:hypothetical protein
MSMITNRSQGANPVKVAGHYWRAFRRVNAGF